MRPGRITFGNTGAGAESMKKVVDILGDSQESSPDMHPNDCGCYLSAKHIEELASTHHRSKELRRAVREYLHHTDETRPCRKDEVLYKIEQLRAKLKVLSGYRAGKG